MQLSFVHVRSCGCGWGRWGAPSAAALTRRAPATRRTRWRSPFWRCRTRSTRCGFLLHPPSPWDIFQLIQGTPLCALQPRGAPRGAGRFGAARRARAGAAVESHAQTLSCSLFNLQKDTPLHAAAKRWRRSTRSTRCDAQAFAATPRLIAVECVGTPRDHCRAHLAAPCAKSPTPQLQVC